jgi:anti-anti-sigma factor
MGVASTSESLGPGELPAHGIGVDRDGVDVLVVVLYGEHDHYSRMRLEDELAQAAAERRAVIIDLRRTTFLDSSIVGALLEAEREADGRGAGFAVVMDDSSGPHVRRMFEVTHLASHFPLFATREGAIAHVRRGAA